jgi:KRAB domain-containing zinc finger protein
VSFNVICRNCFRTLEEFEAFHKTAVSSQQKITEALSSHQQENILRAFVSEKSLKSSMKTDEPLIQVEFFCAENEIEVIDCCELSNADAAEESAVESTIDNTKSESFNLECMFCSKIYKRQSHFERHVEKNHQDGIIKKTKLFERICDLCGKKFSKENHYNNHMNVISCVSSKKPECRYCNEHFLNFSQLRHHLSFNHSDGHKHCCPICFKYFPTASNKNSHMETHNPENSITCHDCNQGFKSVLYLRKHQKAIHTKVERVCLICDRKFESQLKFEYHVKSHNSVKRYKCDHEGCDKSFMQHHHLENHKTTHNGQSKFLCFICGKEFKQDCNLKTHLKIHESDKNIKTNFRCSYQDCGRSFQTNSSFRDHNQTHEKFSDSQCPECDRKFAQKSSLRAHFQTHFRNSIDKPFKCTQPKCDRSFYQERSVKYHVKTAHGMGEPVKRKISNLIYFCDFCSASFKLQSLLKRHLMSHIEEEKINRKHECDKCEARFKRPEHLRLHTNSVHLKLKKFKCETCNKSFAQAGDRNVHMNVHSDLKPHVCFCQKSFRLAKGLKAHQKTHSNQKA